ncbi:neogenin protein frazzled [Leptinotarsa decemlineata]|uniref:neogenin protein frazzled n=1 Tax=Leptinotarsa decemlineata TaxID=7539 RepID=UPI003D30D081
MSPNSRDVYGLKYSVFLVMASVLTSIQSSIQVHVLEFTVEPSDTVVEVGQSAVLDCVVKASHHQSSVLIQWLDQDGSKLTFIGDSYRSQLTNGSLYITSVIEEERLTGNYQCMATLPNVGSLVSRTAKLSIANLLGFQEEPSDISVYLGQHAYFACRVVGVPPPKIRWLKDERPMVLDDLRMVILPSGALEIDEVVESDQGSYRCNATSLSSHKLSNKAILHINGDQEQAAHVSAPNFIAKPQPGTYIEGQNVSLDCAANGNPAPSIMWLKDGYPIDLNDLDSRFSLVGTTTSLRITKIHEEDGGTYQCRAENREDSLDESALIHIQVPPKFLKKPQDKVEFLSKDVELVCSVYGVPDPKIQWFKNGELVKYSEYYKLVNGYNLKIMGLVLSDSGIFQCFASNEAGNIQAAASLKVLPNQETIPSPKHAPSKKMLSQQSKSLFSSLKSEAKISRGSDPSFDPHSAFNSLKSSETEIDPLGDIQFAFTPSPDDPVSAAGSGGKGVAQGVPGPPQDLRAPIVKARFVILSWKPPLENGDSIQAYSIYYRQEGSDRERFQNTTRSKLEEANIGSLSPGRVYHFRIVPYNANGAGVSSEVLTVTTQSEEHVASAPRDFSVRATSPRNVHLSWQPPETANGRILRYTVYYMETSASIEHNVDTFDLSYDLNGLTPFTEYSVWVVAVNHNGAGAATEEKLVRTFSAPPSEPPFNITIEPSSTSITVRWEPPPPESRNGVILGYKLKWRRAGRGKGNTYTTQPSDRHYVINDLEKGAPYQIRLWAMNINGTSPPSEWIEVETFQNDVDESRVPDKPSVIRVRPTYDELYVMWSPPLNQNIRVRHYILGWGKGIPDMYTHELEERNRTYIIRRLEPNSEYVLSLRASNQVGAGAPIYTTVKTQVEPPPEPVVTLFPPMGLKAQVLSTTSVVLYWTDPTLKQSQYVKDNRYYIVKYTDEKQRRTKYLNVTDLNVMVDDLKPNTLYDFSVKLVKGRKESSWSMVVQNRTWELPLNVAPRDLFVHFKDDESQLVELSWQPPKTYTGRINGYVILYTYNKSLLDPEWNASAVKGDVHSTVIYNLKPFTLYYFKVQARNSRGYGPFSNLVTFRTGQSVASHASIQGQPSDTGGVFSSEVLLYTIIGGCVLAVLTITGVVVFFCCRRREATTSPDRNKKGYQKSSQNIKPPDLWIHHDQMELKAMEKRHSHNDGASSSGALTLPRSMGGNEYEQHDSINTNSLDKRTYVPNYVGSDVHRGSLKSKKINFPGDLTPTREAVPSLVSQSSSDSTPSSRQTNPRGQYSLSRPHVPLEQTISHNQAPDNVYITHPVHTSYDPAVPLSSGYIGQPQPVPHSLPASSGATPPVWALSKEGKDCRPRAIRSRVSRCLHRPPYPLRALPNPST